MNEDLRGVLLDDRYLVGDVIGSGGFGVVYAAMHVGLYNKVALKVPRIASLPPTAVTEAIARFLDEGRTLKLLRHPNLAAALDVGLLPPDADGVAIPYLVLEWCEGTTLKEWRAALRGHISAPDAWRALRPVFEAVAHAHAAGVVHRDLKPVNIIMETTPEGEVIPRVIDFGIAKIVDVAEDDSPSGETRTISVNRAFTPRYAAPEQLAGLRTGPRTDVYALALLLLETLRGKPVFATDDEARRALVESDFPTPAKLGLDLGAWSEVLERALAPAPAERYADARAFIVALDAAAGESATRGPTEDGAEDGTGDAVGAADAPAGHPSTSSTPRAEPPIAEETGVPSSHTVITGPDASTEREATVGRRPGRAVALAAVLVTGLVLVVVAWRARAPRGTTGPSVAPTTSISAPAGPAAVTPAPLRPLRTVDERELLDGAKRGGLTDCKVLAGASAVLMMVTCSNGEVMAQDLQPGAAKRTPDALQYEMQYRAKSATRAPGSPAARFAIDDGFGVLVAAPSAIVDAAFDGIVAGYAHGPIGTEKPPPVQINVPPRLADWKGPELLARAESLGFDISHVSVWPTTTQVHVTDSGGITGVLTLVLGATGDLLPRSRAGKVHFSYATDGGATLLVYGGPPVGDPATVTRVLGSTTAAAVTLGK